MSDATPQQYSAGPPYRLFKFDESSQPHNDGYGIYDCAGVNRLTFTDAPGRVWCIGYDEAKRIEDQFNGVAQKGQANL